MAPLFGMVRELQTGKSRFAMKMRLIHSYNVNRFNSDDEVYTHECIFQDKEENQVHASVQHTAVSTMMPLLKPGKIYCILKFLIVDNNVRPKTTECKDKILIFKHTKVTEVEDETFPSQKFNIKSFEEIASITDMERAALFDVMGVIVASYQPQTKDINGRPTKLMDIMIENLEGKTISCTLWGTYADQMHDFLCAEPSEPVCIIIRFCRLNVFRGEVRITTSYNASDIVFDVNIPEIKEMKESYGTSNKKRSGALKLLAAPAIRTVEDEINDGISTLKMISELSTTKDGSFWVYGEIYEVKTIGAWAYMACKICLTKLKKDDELFFCERCQSFNVGGRMRYRLRVVIADDSGSADFILWDRECMQLIGKTASELSVEAGGCDMPFDIDALTSKVALFKIIIKPGETKMNDGAYPVNKVNSDAEMIEKYCGPHPQSEPEKKEIEKDACSSAEIKVGESKIATDLVDLTDELGSKRPTEENAPIVMNKKSKRVTIKQEKI